MQSSSHLVHVTNPSIWEATTLKPRRRIDNYVPYHCPVGSTLVVVKTAGEVRSRAGSIRLRGTCTRTNM